MARRSKPKTPTKRTAPKKAVRRKKAAKNGLGARLRRLIRPVGRAALWAVAGGAALVLLAILLMTFINPPTTPYIISEARRLGGVDHQWVDIDEMSPNLIRAVVAAEDANFCLHWGFDMGEIRKALDEGAARGASTLTQQAVKNVFLWQRRSWARKALEAGLTPVAELVWTKRRIVEIYLNVAEFDEGVFGAEAAARGAFRVGPDKITLSQAARLAAVLPDPKNRSAAQPSAFVWARAAAIADGAETIRVDGRWDCLRR